MVTSVQRRVAAPAVSRPTEHVAEGVLKLKLRCTVPGYAVSVGVSRAQQQPYLQLSEQGAVGRGSIALTLGSKKLPAVQVEAGATLKETTKALKQTLERAGFLVTSNGAGHLRVGPQSRGWGPLDTPGGAL